MRYDLIKGLKQELERGERVSTIYDLKYVEQFSKLRESFEGGKAIFH